jgi:hypothetical protein
MTQPELGVLRKTDHEELIAAELDMRTATTGAAKRRWILYCPTKTASY